jgi:hypothetical protein
MEKLYVLREKNHIIKMTIDINKTKWLIEYRINFHFEGPLIYSNNEKIPTT